MIVEESNATVQLLRSHSRSQFLYLRAQKRDHSWEYTTNEAQGYTNSLKCLTMWKWTVLSGPHACRTIWVGAAILRTYTHTITIPTTEQEPHWSKSINVVNVKKKNICLFMLPLRYRDLSADCNLHGQILPSTIPPKMKSIDIRCLDTVTYTSIPAKTMHLPPRRDHHLCMLACMGLARRFMTW
jgi:hypothetical protein